MMYVTSGDWLWIKLLRSPADLHLHPVQILPGTGGHFWGAVRCGNRHVEPWMYSGRASDRPTAVCWWGRGRPDCLHHWDNRHASFKGCRCWEEIVEFHSLKWLSTVTTAFQHCLYTCYWLHIFVTSASSAWLKASPARDHVEFGQLHYTVAAGKSA